MYSITSTTQVIYYPQQGLMINVLQKGSVSSAVGTQGGQSNLSSPAGKGSHCQQANITRSGSMIKWVSNEAGKMKSRLCFYEGQNYIFQPSVKCVLFKNEVNTGECALLFSSQGLPNASVTPVPPPPRYCWGNIAFHIKPDHRCFLWRQLHQIRNQFPLRCEFIIIFWLCVCWLNPLRLFPL